MGIGCDFGSCGREEDLYNVEYTDTASTLFPYELVHLQYSTDQMKDLSLLKCRWRVKRI